MIEIEVIHAFVTAGGKSLRMGTDKGLMLLMHQPMIEYLISMLEEQNFITTIIANNDSYKKKYKNVISDSIADKGPMGALYTAMQHSTKPYILLLGCDTPFIPPKAIERLLANANEDMICVASIAEKMNPLIAIYPFSIYHKVVSCIENDQLKMQDFIRQLPHHIISMDDIAAQNSDAFINFNEPNDVETWKNRKKI